MSGRAIVDGTTAEPGTAATATSDNQRHTGIVVYHKGAAATTVGYGWFFSNQYINDLPWRYHESTAHVSPQATKSYIGVAALCTVGFNL